MSREDGAKKNKSVAATYTRSPRREWKGGLGRVESTDGGWGVWRGLLVERRGLRGVVVCDEVEVRCGRVEGCNKTEEKGVIGVVH